MEDGYIVAVDPGNEKCGAALLDALGKPLERRVVPRSEIFSLLESWLAVHTPATLVVGDRTGSKQFLRELAEADLEDGFAAIHLVDEHLSTQEARQRYFEEHRRTGWRRLIPASLQTPPEPIDDYVAVILGERYLARTDR